MAFTEKDTVSLTPKQIGIILAVILALVGGFPIGVNKLTPTGRHDPFTGEDGKLLRAEIRRECQSNIGFIQSQINDIKATDAEIRNKYADHSHEAPPRWVREKLKSLDNDISKAIQRINDHDKESNAWKHRIISLESEIKSLR